MQSTIDYNLSKQYIHRSNWLLALVAQMAYWFYAFSLLALILLGVVSARTVGADVLKAVLRISIWGSLVMGLSALVGAQFRLSV